MAASKNLGTVRAIHIGSTPPTNTAMLWYNTGTVGYIQYKQYFYDVPSTTWKLLGKDLVSAVILDNSVNSIVVGIKSLHKLISFKFIVVRNGAIASGMIEIVNYSNTLQIAESIGRTLYGDNSEIDESAIIFSTVYDANNIVLHVTCSNTGSNGTIDLFNIDQIN